MAVVIVDCGIGNIKSIQRMIQHIGGSARIISDPELARSAEKIILPGVGAFDSGMEALANNGWLPVLNYLALEKQIPFLGICLGMQLLFSRSEEGQKEGLSFIQGQVLSFRKSDLGELKIPHMGWCDVQIEIDNPLLSKKLDSLRFYHVHRYHAVCDNSANILATADYGINFVTAVMNKNIFGVQFHPEKSHKYGMELFKNFLEL